MTLVEEVLQAHLAILAAHNSGDDAAMMSFYHPQFTIFHAENGLCYNISDIATLQASNNARYQGQVNPRQTDVKVFGNCAVITCYVSGMFTWAGSGSTEYGTWRLTGVWSKEGDVWKYVHAHISLLAPRHHAA